METRKGFLASSFLLFLVIFLTISLHGVTASSEEHHVTPHVGPVVERDQRRTLFDTEYGEISSIEIKSGHRAPPYHLQFFTLEPNSVFLPVLLHANMVFYVHTGSGRLTWTAEGGGTSRTDLHEGDLFKLSEGSVFYIHSNLEVERKKLRIYAMFANTEDTTYDPSIGAYSRINELVRGFDKKIIQAAFKVPEDLIEAITNKTDTPAIVHANSKEHKTFWELEATVLNKFLGIRSNGKKGKTYNIFDKDPDFKNCHGWSLTVTKKQLKSLKGTNTGFLMVNLTTGSMLGPHWNPSATEIAVVLEGEGMVRVVCASSNNNEDKMEECTNMRFRVKQGDVFVVPRFHPMAQMSFNNDSLVFLGFSTAAKENYPQFLAGKRSVLGALDRHILAASFGVTNTTIDKLFTSQDDSIIFGCVSCAEEEERMMQEEIERKKKAEEEERKRLEEEARQREEEEKEKERRRKEEEEEARKREEEARKQQEERERRREEEEARRQEEAKREEERRREEEARKREEEEARRQQEKRERKREEEEARRQEEAQREQEEAKREEEEARKQQEERERRRQEEEARRQEEAKREEEAQREQERARRQKEAKREEEQARRQQEERERRRKEEEARRQEEAQREQEKAKIEEEEARKQQEERERRREEEEARRQEEAQKKQEEAKREEEAQREQERARRQKEAKREEEQARRQQEKRERRREQERGREEEETERGREGGRRPHRRQRQHEERTAEEAAAQREQEQARRQQEERERRREQESEREEEQAERERGGGGRRRDRRERSREEEGTAEWEQEEARRQQEERERRRREQEGDEVEAKGNRSSFEGRRVFKVQSV